MKIKFPVIVYLVIATIGFVQSACKDPRIGVERYSKENQIRLQNEEYETLVREFVKIKEKEEKRSMQCLGFAEKPVLPIDSTITGYVTGCGHSFAVKGLSSGKFLTISFNTERLNHGTCIDLGDSLAVEIGIDYYVKGPFIIGYCGCLRSNEKPIKYRMVSGTGTGRMAVFPETDSSKMYWIPYPGDTVRTSALSAHLKYGLFVYQDSSGISDTIRVEDELFWMVPTDFIAG
ncbi:MAG: hypothetical protein AB8F95_05295 [Bacteroidia bacterium]